MKTDQIKTCIAIVFVCVGLFTSSLFANFEQKYFCTINQNSITVSIQTGTDYCFSYASNIHESIQNLYSDIANAQDHIRGGEDVEYRTDVKRVLETKQTKILDLQEKLIAAIDDYELDLFKRTKTILAVYLRHESIDLEEQYSQTANFLRQVKKMGDRNKYDELVDQYNNIYYRLSLLRAMRDSKSFVELIYPLKQYIKLVRKTETT